MASNRLTWIIEVCRHCGRLANWPGCKHWQQEPGWTVPVKVMASAGDSRRLVNGFDDWPKAKEIGR